MKWLIMVLNAPVGNSEITDCDSLANVADEDKGKTYQVCLHHDNNHNTYWKVANSDT